MDTIAKRALEIITSNDEIERVLDELEVLVDVNQCQLNAIGVGHAKLNKIVETTGLCFSFEN